MKNVLVSYFAGIAMVMATPVSAEDAAPNLVPRFGVGSGQLWIENVSRVAAPASVATIECEAQNGGSCPEPSAAEAAPYQMPGFANKLAIPVPKLAAEQSFGHRIRFFPDLEFAPGAYDFTVCADAGNDIKESDEQDNCSRLSRTVAAQQSGNPFQQMIRNGLPWLADW